MIANPAKFPGGPGLILGDNVLISAGASVLGPGQIGSPGGAATSIGANSVINNANVQAGAQVGALANVGPGVTILSGYRVLPGATVTTEAEATNPALGKVARLTGTDPVLTQILSDNVTLAAGYASLYQGNSATGASAGATVATVFNGQSRPCLGIEPKSWRYRRFFRNVVLTEVCQPLRQTQGLYLTVLSLPGDRSDHFQW